MKRSVRYYNVYITKNGEYTEIDFSDLLDKIKQIKWENRLRKIKVPVSLFDLDVPPKTTNRVAMIGKYRHDIKPYVGDINIEKADFINQDIIEMVTMVAFRSSRLVAVEFNQYGCKAGDLQDYFNSFFENDKDNQWRVVFEVVPSGKSINDIRMSPDISKVELRVNAQDNMLKRFDEIEKMEKDYLKEEKSLVQKIRNYSVGMKDTFDANVITMAFSKGRNKDAHLKIADVFKLVEVLNMAKEEDLIEAIRVKFYNETTKQSDEVDLMNIGMLKKSIEINGENIKWSTLWDKIVRMHDENGCPGADAHSKRGYKLTPARLPKLKIEPPEKCKVNIGKGDRVQNE